MKLYVISDLHLEIASGWRFPDNVGDFDVAVVAGDVNGSVRRAVETLSGAAVLKDKPVIFTPGNQEYYGSIYQDNLADGIEAAESSNVHVMHRRSLVIDGVRFVGATLWTDYKLLGTTKPSMVLAGHEMNDHHLIRYREVGGHISRFMPWNARAEHLTDLGFIRSALSEPHDGATVVVTHHLPSPSSIGMRFQGSPLNPAFASNLDQLILDASPAVWIHGHTHSMRLRNRPDARPLQSEGVPAFRQARRERRFRCAQNHHSRTRLRAGRIACEVAMTEGGEHRVWRGQGMSLILSVICTATRRGPARLRTIRTTESSYGRELIGGNVT